jgi:hypothetical protein
VVFTAEIECEGREQRKVRQGRQRHGSVMAAARCGFGKLDCRLGFEEWVAVVKRWEQFER